MAGTVFLFFVCFVFWKSFTFCIIFFCLYLYLVHIQKNQFCIFLVQKCKLYLFFKATLCLFLCVFEYDCCSKRKFITSWLIKVLSYL